MTDSERILDTEDCIRFLFAGKSTVTLKSAKTDRHYTYRITRADDPTQELFFVGLLIDSDRYNYMCLLEGVSIQRETDDGVTTKPMVDRPWVALPDLTRARLRTTARSKVSAGSNSYKALEFFIKHLKRGTNHPDLEVLHEGRCGRCNRKLTHPDSIKRGIGPECAAMMGVD